MRPVSPEPLGFWDLERSVLLKNKNKNKTETDKNKGAVPEREKKELEGQN